MPEHAATPSTTPPIAHGDAVRLLGEITGFSGQPAALLHLLTRVQRELLGASHLAIVHAPAPDTAGVLASSPPVSPDVAPPAWIQRACPLAAESIREGGPRSAPEPNGAGTVLVVPLAAAGEPTAAAAYVFDTVDPVELERLAARAQLVATTLSIYHLHADLSIANLGGDRLLTAIDVASAVNNQTRWQAAATTLVNELVARLSAERASLGARTSVTDQATRVVAISGVDKLKRSMDLVGEIEAAMDESLDQDLETSFPYGPDETMIARQAETLSRRQGPSAVAVFPLRSPAGPIAAVVVEREPERPFTREELTLLRLMGNLVAPRLLDLLERDRPLIVRAGRSLRRAAMGLAGPRHALAKLAVLGVGLFVAGAAVTLGPDVATAPFVVQAQTRRTVSAPAAGFLATIEVRVGDSVAAGAMLGTLDDSDLRLELAEARARHTALARSGEAARGRGEIAEAQVAEAQLEEAGARIALLERQLDRTALAAPIGGVVLQAADTFSLNAPVERGQPLFDIAPLGTLRAEIALPEDRLPHIAVGQEGRLLATGAPDQPIALRVTSIAPAATDPGEHEAGAAPTFAVRASLEDQPAWLRPGMEGVAKVRVGSRPYLSIWTRKLANWIRLNVWR